MRPAPTATLTHCVLLGVAARLTIISGTAPPLRSERRCPDGSINSFGPCPAPLVPEPAFHAVGPPEVPPPPLVRTRITVAPSERGANVASQRPRMKTMRTTTGVSYRVPLERTDADQLCPDSTKWLVGHLQETGNVAYTVATNLRDPKQRRAGNEIYNWCAGDPFQLWSEKLGRPISNHETLTAFEAHGPSKP